MRLPAAVVLATNSASILCGSSAFVIPPTPSSQRGASVTVTTLASSINPIKTVGGGNEEQPKPSPKVNVESEKPKVTGSGKPIKTVGGNSDGEAAAKEKEATSAQPTEEDAPELVSAASPDFDAMVQSAFPGALSNDELKTRIRAVLETKGYTPQNTLLCTSLCCDELARNLEKDLAGLFDKNFHLGGLAGFPFAGNTGFGAMSAHVPDDGYCLLVHGPHVGISQDGVIGKVERKSIELVDNCCGSAIAASNYVQGITDGGHTLTTKIQSFTDFQQGAVQELILPHGKRLADAGEERMKELPYALYDSQDVLVREIVAAGAGGIKSGLALLGGIQINSGPDTPDYFHPLRFDFINSKGETVEDLLPSL